MVFLVVAGVLLFINALFLIGSIIYTLKATKSEGDPRLSTLGSVLDSRMSLQPQVVLYDVIVRISGNPSLSQQPHGTEKTDNQTKQVAS